uniref:HDC08895 n=1 Tax=Drosophila melanogaster TaxID=7227 RepID=Q6ILM8_DROME|nr:TPA_inf: HDC08895 [Drosophila melanogaster]
MALLSVKFKMKEFSSAIFVSWLAFSFSNCGCPNPRPNPCGTLRHDDDPEPRLSPGDPISCLHVHGAQERRTQNADSSNEVAEGQHCLNKRQYREGEQESLSQDCGCLGWNFSKMHLPSFISRLGKTKAGYIAAPL